MLIHIVNAIIALVAVVIVMIVSAILVSWIMTHSETRDSSDYMISWCRFRNMYSAGPEKWELSSCGLFDFEPAAIYRYSLYGQTKETVYYFSFLASFLYYAFVSCIARQSQSSIPDEGPMHDNLKALRSSNASRDVDRRPHADIWYSPISNR